MLHKWCISNHSVQVIVYNYMPGIFDPLNNMHQMNDKTQIYRTILDLYSNHYKVYFMKQFIFLWVSLLKTKGLIKTTVDKQAHKN